MLHRDVNGRCRQGPVSLAGDRTRRAPGTGRGTARAARARPTDHPGRDRPRARRLHGLPRLHLGSRRGHGAAGHGPAIDGGPHDRHRPTARRHRSRWPPPDDGRDRERDDRDRRAGHAVQLPGLVARRIADRGRRHDRGRRGGLRLHAIDERGRGDRPGHPLPQRRPAAVLPLLGAGRPPAGVPDDRADRSRAAHRAGRRNRPRDPDPVGLAALLGVGGAGPSDRPQRGGGRRRLLRHHRARRRRARAECCHTGQLPGPRGHGRRTIPGLHQPGVARAGGRGVDRRRDAACNRRLRDDRPRFRADRRRAGVHRPRRPRTRRWPAHRAAAADRCPDRCCPDPPRGLGRGLLLVAGRGDPRGAPGRAARRRQHRA